MDQTSDSDTESNLSRKQSFERPNVRASIPSKSRNGSNLPPLSDTLQRYTLYESKMKFYLVASNKSDSQFRVLKIDRSDSEELILSEDPTVYTKDQIHTLLSMIEAANLSNGGLRKVLTAYAVGGFIRFMQGYYMLLITGRRRVGAIGGHVVYTVSDTQLIYLPHPDVIDEVKAKWTRAEEARYKSLFQLIDLTKNFYFSYTYNITRSLQFNMSRAHSGVEDSPQSAFVWNHFLLQNTTKCLGPSSNNWGTPLIQGYFEQVRCSVFGRSVTLTLISRRSRLFAGTRYLKRGVNDKGNVANDVETEQILHDRTGGCPVYGQFASYVQMRASIPLFWTQESNAMVAKPPIIIQKVDPTHKAMRLHFQDIFRRYGAPCLVLNLVRQKEPRGKEREIVVGSPFGEGVEFINQFLPRHLKLDYYAWDFKKTSKSKKQSVIDKLAVMAEWCLQRTGLFHSHPRPDSRLVLPQDTLHHGPNGPRAVSENEKRLESEGEEWVTIEDHNSDPNVGWYQRGVCRCNCVDSLDRTNVAQFCIGKHALAYQLYTFGILESTTMDSDSDITSVLLNMYERMGDCLALQYGGSQMHRQIKKDREKTITMAPVLHRQKTSTKPKEMFVSLMRHYQNSFQDNEKQDAMNLFLGRFIPSRVPGNINLWELGSDFYLHNDLIYVSKSVAAAVPLLCEDYWWKRPLLEFERSIAHLPKPELLRRRYLSYGYTNRIEELSSDEPEKKHQEERKQNVSEVNEIATNHISSHAQNHVKVPGQDQKNLEHGSPKRQNPGLGLVLGLGTGQIGERGEQSVDQQEGLDDGNRALSPAALERQSSVEEDDVELQQSIYFDELYAARSLTSFDDMLHAGPSHHLASEVKISRSNDSGQQDKSVIPEQKMEFYKSGYNPNTETTNSGATTMWTFENGELLNPDSEKHRKQSNDQLPDTEDDKKIDDESHLSFTRRALRSWFAFPNLLTRLIPRTADGTGVEDVENLEAYGKGIEQKVKEPLTDGPIYGEPDVYTDNMDPTKLALPRAVLADQSKGESYMTDQFDFSLRNHIVPIDIDLRNDHETCPTEYSSYCNRLQIDDCLRKCQEETLLFRKHGSYFQINVNPETSPYYHDYVRTAGVLYQHESARQAPRSKSRTSRIAENLKFQKNPPIAVF